jgi:GT2 family glycosyltransferase
MTRAPRPAGKAARRPLITAAICTYRRYDLLGDAIASLLRQSMPPDQYRIVVVDNSPDADFSLASAGRWSGAPNLLWRHEKTAGLSNARNVATAAADTPVIAFLDDDALACPGWLEALLEAFERLGPQAHIIGGLVRPRFAVPRPAWLDDRMQAYLSVCDLGGETRFLRPGEWVVGANISYRADRLREAGGFSTALGRVGGGAALMSNDETELADRIRANGGLTGYAPRAEVEHFVPAERLTQEWFRRRIAWQAVSDFVHAPQHMQAAAGDAWQRLKGYLASCPPADRTLRALATPQADPGRFAYQMSAVYETIVALLSGHPEPDADADPE